MITMTTRRIRRSVRPAAAPAPAQPAAPQCLHPSCHAHNSHQTAQRAAGQVPPMPATQPLIPAAPRRPWWKKITKNMVIAGLVVIIIGLAGSLNDDDHKIADLQQQVRHAKSTKGDATHELDYVIKLCKQIAAKGDYAQCVTETLAQKH